MSHHMNQAEIDQILKDVSEIKRALVGNKEFGEEGLIRDVKDLKKWKQQIALKVAFYSGAGSVVVIGLSKAFEWLTFNHK